MNKPQLICFTYAGGNASFFDAIEKDLPEVEFLKLDYAGHGTRHKEPFYDSFEQLADDLFCFIKRVHTDVDYSLFGYSMGTIALAEVLQRIIADSEMKEPSNVFLAAHEPHSKAELAGFTDDELDEWVKERTIRFGAVPEKLINNKSFWRMYLPLYRADYSIIGKYRFDDLRLTSSIPATVFYSETDTPKAEMELWEKYFIGKCDFYQFNGTHFFIQEHHKEMAEIMQEKIIGRTSQ